MNSIFVLTLSDALYVVVGGLLIGVWALVSLAEWWRKARCKHDGGVNETKACDAVCRKCGKNLGFIGNWRKDNVA
jgi:hypothetical protein